MATCLYSVDLTIRPDEADRNGCLTIRSLCNYFQHAAFLHADSLDFGVVSLGRTGKTWVLTRLYVETRRPPRYGEKVQVATWPTGVDSLFALRDFRLLDAAGQELAAGASSWCVINLTTRRITRPPEELARFSENPRAVAHTPGKIDPLRTVSPIIKNLDVRFRDIDVNRHVNNVAFIEWICEVLPAEIHADYFCRTFEINFLKEAFYGDTILSFAAPIPDGGHAFQHALRRREEEEDCARAITRWEKIN